MAAGRSLSINKKIELLDLGIKDYAETWAYQKELVDQRVRGEIPDTLLFVEHPHVVTLGRKHANELLASTQLDIPVYEIERGGEATYHGPGQLVGYPILKLEDGNRDLHGYFRSLEQVLIDALMEMSLNPTRNEGSTGVWLEGKPMRKIASIGIAVRRWVTYHGFALNVSTDLSYFRLISPCGFDGSIMTSITSESENQATMPQVKQHVIRAFEKNFNRTTETSSESVTLSP